MNISAYKQILEALRRLEENRQAVDLLISNFVYDKEGARHKKVMRYGSVLLQNRIFTWKDTKWFHIGQYLLMHSMIYRTAFLRKSGLKLPEHTF